MDFPQGSFDYETLTTIIFFESFHRLINVKIHLHHSHVTSKIYGYAHDFCNMKLRENQNQFSSITHNCLVGFGMFFLFPTFVLYALSCIYAFFSYVRMCLRVYVLYEPMCFTCLYAFTQLCCFFLIMRL